MKRFGIIGRPISHSASGQWYAAFFSQHQLDATFVMYEPTEADMADFPRWVSTQKLDGLLVTIPFKKEILPFLTETDQHAAAIGAVNVISVQEQAGLQLMKGFNIDYLAFATEIFRLRPSGFRKAVVLGNGGAAAAVVYALKLHGISYTKVSRQASADCITYADLSEDILCHADLIINATSLGMKPLEEGFPPLRYDCLNPTALAYDLIYNPAETVFMKKCSEAGCESANGRGMVEFVYRRALDLWPLL